MQKITQTSRNQYENRHCVLEMIWTFEQIDEKNGGCINTAAENAAKIWYPGCYATHPLEDSNTHCTLIVRSSVPPVPADNSTRNHKHRRAVQNRQHAQNP